MGGRPKPAPLAPRVTSREVPEFLPVEAVAPHQEPQKEVHSCCQLLAEAL